MAEAVAKENPNVLIIERIFDAPQEQVFKAWTEPERLMQWFCCKGFKVVSAEVDLRAGGAWRSSMESPDGNIYTEAGVFREIVPPERLVITWAWEALGGGEGHQIGYETLVTVTFDALDDDKTKMLFRQEFFESVESRDSHNQGWSEALDNLDEYLGKV
jgi:uncharacterized protein YndB with AHSA1/START domain